MDKKLCKFEKKIKRKTRGFINKKPSKFDEKTRRKPIIYTLYIALLEIKKSLKSS